MGKLVKIIIIILVYFNLLKLKVLQQKAMKLKKEVAQKANR